MSVKKVHVVLFDIDGCLADDRHRKHLIPSDPANTQASYDEYNGLSELDPVFPLSKAVFREWAKRMRAAGGHVAFLTARPEYMRRVTMDWLRHHLGDQEMIRDSFLLMRPEKNMLTSPVLKLNQLSWLEDQLAHLYRGQHAQMIVTHAFDDRVDVLAMYHERGIPCSKLAANCVAPMPYVGVDDLTDGAQFSEPSTATFTGRTAEQFGAGVNAIMHDALKTFESRNGDYSYNAEKVGHVMEALFPNGITLQGAGDFHMFHLFELLMVKVTRFANSGLKHTDSMRDAGVYSFMCENLTEDHAITIHKPKKEENQ